jgi:hypothetical protein
MRTFAAIALILVLCIAAFFVRTALRLREFAAPAPIERTFAEWGDDWQLPPMQPAEYWLICHPAQLLKIAVVDETTGETVPIDGGHVGGTTPDSMIVGELEMLEGHRYAVQVDAGQIENGRLEIAPTPAEINNRVGRAIFGGPRWRPSRRKRP